MKIESYEFGRIVIDGRAYREDLILFLNRIQENWIRKEGHSLCIDDIKGILEEKPEALVIGNGCYGMMVVPPVTKEAIKGAGITLIEEPTDKAIKSYNELSKRLRTAGAFHLTC